jgi:hypothetical protein
VILLSTVIPGRERYCPILAKHLDAMWPGHPDLYFALPKGKDSSYDKIIRTSAETWLETLQEGLEHLKKTHSHVFILLEDHFPLKSCDGGLIEKVLLVMQEENFKCVFFVKYEWPWHKADFHKDSDGRMIGWDKIDTVTFKGLRFAKMPVNFFKYNQCQPAIWEIDYYLQVIHQAAKAGAFNPWQFESYTAPNQSPHFVCDYRWPSITNGYLSKGIIDWGAIREIEMPKGKVLRQALLKEFFKHSPFPAPILFLIGEMYFRLPAQIKYILRPLARRLKTI